MQCSLCRIIVRCWGRLDGRIEDGGQIRRQGGFQIYRKSSMQVERIAWSELCSFQPQSRNERIRGAQSAAQRSRFYNGLDLKKHFSASWDEMKKRATTYLAFGIVFVVSGCFIYKLNFGYSYFAFFAIGIVLVKYGAEYLLDKDEMDDLNRDAIMGISLMIPGSIHYVLMRKEATETSIRIARVVRGVLMTSTFVICFINLIYSLSLTENPEYYQYIFLSITVGLLGIFAMMLWSAFETNDYCNRQNMPYVGGEFELEIQNTKRATTILFLVTSIVLLLLIHAAMTFEFD